MVEKDTRDQEAIVNHESESLLEDLFDTEEDILMAQTQAFQGIYKREYLLKVLSESWKEESIHQMSLRHEAELNELKKMHTQQKQELLDEMRRRKEKVRRIGEKMRNVRKNKKEYNEGESMSQLMEFESNSVRSKDLTFKGYFMITDDLLTDNLSRINVPHTSQEAEFTNKEDVDLIGNHLMNSANNFKSQVTLTKGPQSDINALSEYLPSLCQNEANQPSTTNLDCELNSLRQNIDPANSSCHHMSPIHCSLIQHQESMQKDDMSMQKIGHLKILPLDFLNCDDHTDNKSLRLAKTQRTIEKRGEDMSTSFIAGRQDALSLKNLSPQQMHSHINYEELYEQLEVDLSDCLEESIARRDHLGESGQRETTQNRARHHHAAAVSASDLS